jgi:hypothetical protein
MDGVKMSNGTNSKDKNFTKEGDDDMTTVAKPNNRAFTLKTEKVDQFLTKKGDTDKVMNRFFAHKPKKGVKTPLKGKDV